MYKLLLFALLACTCTVSFCQTVYPYKDIKLEKPTDYSETEPVALSAAGLLLSTAFVEADANRAAALEFLLSWMAGAKDQQFYRQGIAAEISDDKNLLGLFIAAIVKYSLENKKEAANPMTVERNAAKLVLAYCDDPKNNFKLKKRYRKLLENNRAA